MKEFPGPNARMWLAKNDKYYAKNTQASRIVPDVDKSLGPIIVDVDGFKFIDLKCGAGVTNLGHQGKEMRISHFEHHDGPVPSAIEFAEMLAQEAPVKKPAKVFFCNSGAEANEAARKACRAFRYHREGSTSRPRALYCENGFAGRTYGVLGATTSKPKTQRDPFIGYEESLNSCYIPYPTRGNLSKLMDMLRRLQLSNFDRVLVELRCQGEGGVIPADELVTEFLYRSTQEAGIFWTTDAVQCGMGRTGSLFGHDFAWLESDLMTIGKAGGGGLPFGAVIFREELDWKPGEHSNTFGGNPTVTRAGIQAFLEIKRLLESGKVKTLEEKVGSRLQYFAKSYSELITEVRGLGAMWAVEFSTPEMRDQFRTIAEGMTASHGMGLALLACGRKAVRIMPPLNIDDTTLEYALNLFNPALSQLLLETHYHKK